MTDAKPRIRRMIRLVLVFAALILAFLVSLAAVYSMPTAPVVANVRASIPRLAAEGVYPRPFIDHPAFQLDSVTDCLMLDAALGDPSVGPFTESVAIYRGVLAPGAASGDPVQLLTDSSAGSRPFPEAYARYWHGYQVLLRPTLSMFTYQEVRYLNMLFQGLMLATLIGLMWSRLGPVPAIALALALAMGGFLVVPLSLQYSSVTYVALIGSLVVILFPRVVVERRSDLELYLVLGSVTAFVDLLTAPLLALGLPLGVALAVRARLMAQGSARDDLLHSARAGLAWFVGYAAAWSAKWVIGALVLGPEVLGGAAEQAAVWTGRGHQFAAVAEALKVNVMNLVPLVRFDESLTGLARYVFVGPIGWFVVATMLVVAILLAFFRRSREEVERAAVMLALIPPTYAWLAALGVHSKLHYWYTYRVQAVVVFAVVYFVGSSVDWNRVRKAALLVRRGDQSVTE